MWRRCAGGGCTGGGLPAGIWPGVARGAGARPGPHRAVADFRPKSTADTKLSKSDGVPEIVLEPTSDILATLARRRRPGQTLVGFAAEDRDVAARAARKLADKGIDLIVANDVSAPGVGFEHDTNAVVIMSADGSDHEVGLTDKQTVARAVVDAVVACRARRSP